MIWCVYTPYIFIKGANNYCKKGEDRMKLENFKDGLFDLLNDSDSLDIADIDTDDKKSVLTVKTLDGSQFEIECRKMS